MDIININLYGSIKIIGANDFHKDHLNETDEKDLTKKM